MDHLKFDFEDSESHVITVTSVLQPIRSGIADEIFEYILAISQDAKDTPGAIAPLLIDACGDEQVAIDYESRLVNALAVLRAEDGVEEDDADAFPKKLPLPQTFPVEVAQAVAGTAGMYAHMHTRQHHGNEVEEYGDQEEEEEEEEVLEDGECELCECVGRERITLHHLIPKLVIRRARKKALKHKSKSKKIPEVLLVALCRTCHSTLHNTFTHMELASRFDSLELLKAAPELQSYLEFKRKRG